MAASSPRILARPLEKLLRVRGSGRSANFHTIVCCAMPGRKAEQPPSCRRHYSEIVCSSTYPPVEMPEMLLHEYIFDKIGNWEDKVAVNCRATGKQLKYRELLKHSKSLAAALQKKFKIEKGHRQALLLPNCPEYPVILLAGSMTGTISTTFNPLYTPHEISYHLKETEPSVIYTIPDLYNKCLDSLNLIQMKIPIIVVKNLPNVEIPSGAVSFSELTECSTPADFCPVAMETCEVLFLPFSSGTSGLPKGVQLTHKNIVSNIIQYNSGNYLKCNPDKETNQTHILCVLPMFHIYGMVIVTLDCLQSGSRLITLPRFEPKSFIDAIYTQKTHILYVAPPLILFLSGHEMVESKHLQYVQHVVCGAAPCGKADMEKLLKKAPNLDICQGYGMTETSPVVTMSHNDRFHKLSSIGHPLVNTLVKVIDVNTGKSLPAGSRGELLVKGPQVMKGYLNRPEATKTIIDEDGWLKTGDICYYDEEGDFFIVDRIKELIKVKGFQVAPAELEEVLRNHPKIADAAVIAIDHPELGQVPKAFVVLEPNSSAQEQEIQDYVKDRLSYYKQLKGGVRILKEIPKSSSGKILKKDLRNME